MFDQIMEHSMSIWLLVSAAYPIFFFGMIVKALRHWRRLRAKEAYAPAIATLREGVRSEDWVATR